MSFTASLAEIIRVNKNGLLGARSDWRRVRLGTVATVLNGFPFPSSKFNRSSGIPLVRIRDVRNTDTEVRYDGPYDPAYLIDHGDLLIGMDGDFHASIWRGGKALLNQRVCKVMPDPLAADIRFLAYLLPGYLAAINAETSSITVKHLSSKTVLDLPIPLPSLRDQRCLVEDLEKQFTWLDAGVDALKRLQAHLRRYRAAVLKAACEGTLATEYPAGSRQDPGDSARLRLQRVLEERHMNWDRANATRRSKSGLRRTYKEPAAPSKEGLPDLPHDWCWATVEQLVEAEEGMITGPFGTLFGKKDHRDTGVPVLGIPNISSGKYIDGSAFHLSPAKAAELAHYRVQADDLVVSRSGTVGEVCALPATAAGALISTNLMRLRLVAGQNLVPWVVSNLQGSAVVARQIADLCKGSTRPFLNLGILSKLHVALPPLQAQSRILCAVDEAMTQADSVAGIVAAALLRSTKLRQAVLSTAFQERL